MVASLSLSKQKLQMYWLNQIIIYAVNFKNTCAFCICSYTNRSSTI